MTENTEYKIRLTPVVERFILHWGEMGGRWGVNRSVAQIHGLLFLSAKPLNADDISEILSIARSNVSNSLKELQNWGLVKTIHVMGERKDHYEALKDVQETFNVIVEGRKRREIDPTLSLLRDLSIEMESQKRSDGHVKKQINEMLSFVDEMSSWYEDVKRLPNERLMKIVRMGSKVMKFLKI